MSDKIEVPLTRRNLIQGAGILMGAGAFTVANAANAEPAEAAVTGVYGKGRVLPWSKKPVTFATRADGGGTQRLVQPGGYFAGDPNSFYVKFVKGSGYLTRVNGQAINWSRPGWYNTVWWFNVEVNVIFDPDYV